ncbi:MAG: MBL fold metallo-hydrolase, partial [Henriciella sp.]
IKHLKSGETDIKRMVAVMYADVDKRLHPAAAMSVLGHMLKLVEEGLVETADTEPTVRSQFSWKALQKTG